jgi:CRISPR-associated endonuclease Csn1
LSNEYPNVKVYAKFVASRFGNELTSLASIPYNAIEIDIKKAIEGNYDICNKEIRVEINKYKEQKLSKENIISLLSKDNSKINVYENKIYKVIESVTDTGIQKILINHLENYKERVDDEGKEIAPQALAFSPEGIKELNQNIKLLNKGKSHQPIYKVRLTDAKGTKFPVSEEGTKSSKYVATASGSNAFCGIYQKGKERMYYVPTLRESVESLKQGYEPCPDSHPEDVEYKLHFVLNPNDIVYVPTEEEIENSNSVDFKKLSNNQLKRVYKFTDSSGTTMNFVPVNIATPIIDIKTDEHKKIKENKLFWEEVNETKKGYVKKIKPLFNEVGLGSENKTKSQNTFDRQQIKSICWKLKVDRLGNISRIN